MQEKHIETAKKLLGEGKLLNDFVSRLLNDIGDLKAMLHAISIGAPACAAPSCPALCHAVLRCRDGRRLWVEGRRAS